MGEYWPLIAWGIVAVIVTFGFAVVRRVEARRGIDYGQDDWINGFALAAFWPFVAGFGILYLFYRQVWKPAVSKTADAVEKKLLNDEQEGNTLLRPSSCE